MHEVRTLPHDYRAEFASRRRAVCESMVPCPTTPPRWCAAHWSWCAACRAL